MKILSIGNSFSQDAQSYLHDLAKHCGEKIKAVNLYIGGCSLYTHYINMLNDAKAYSFEFNSESTGLKVSISQALSSDEWDVVTLQQASPLSGSSESYSPYIEELAKYVRKYSPKAKIMIHETWAYEDGSDKLLNLVKFSSAREMYESIKSAYAKAAASINADGIIPSGTAMINAYEMGIEKVHRDGGHASFGVGRYILALCWFKYLTGKDITGNDFNALRLPITEEERAIAIAAVNKAIG